MDKNPVNVGGGILARSSRISNSKSKAESSPLSVKASSVSRPSCPRCQKPGHLESNSINRVHCAACSKLDHRASVCSNQKSEKKVWVRKPKAKKPIGSVISSSSRRPATDSLVVSGKSLEEEHNILVGIVLCLNYRQLQPDASSSSLPLALRPNPIYSAPKTPMANINPDPTPFVPPTMAINDAWLHCLPRADLIIMDEPPKKHEGIAVAILEPPPKKQEHFVLVVYYVQNTLGYHVLDTSRHASEFAFIHIASAVLRDALVLGGPYDVNEQITLRFVNHDNTSTCRNSPPIREGWVMFLDFPLDLQTDRIVDKPVGTFGWLLCWSSGPRFRGRVLAKVIYSMVEEVPL